MIFNSILSFAIIWKKIFVKTSTYFITKSVEFIISTCFMPDILIASILAVLCAQQKQNITAHSIDWANEFNKSASFHALKSCIECNPVVITFLGHRLHKIDSFAWRIWLIICFISSSNRFKPIQRLYLTGDKKIRHWTSVWTFGEEGKKIPTTFCLCMCCTCIKNRTLNELC